MTRQEKLDTLKDFMTKEHIFYEVNPMNQKEMDDYMYRVKAKLPELYKFCIKLDIVKENSYDSFIHMLEHSINVGVNKALFGGM